MRSKQDIKDAHQVMTEQLGGMGVSAFVPHAAFPSVADSGILSVFTELPDTPIPEPPDEEEPPPPEDEGPDLPAIARTLNNISQRLAEIAQELG